MRHPDLTSAQHLEQARKNMRIIDDPRIQLGSTQVAAATTAIAHFMAAQAFPDPVTPRTIPEPFSSICCTTWLVTIEDDHVHRCNRAPRHNDEHICKCGERIQQIVLKKGDPNGN